MYVHNNRYISDPGKCFKTSSGAHVLSSDKADLPEVDINLDNLQRISERNWIVDNKFLITLSPDTKKELVEKIYSKDDQIAIMLNYMDTKTAANKEAFVNMQSWRKFFSELISKLS